jgi:hypothetical protein
MDNKPPSASVSVWKRSIAILLSKQYRDNRKADITLLALASCILILKYANIHLIKVSVLGSEIEADKPFIVTGVLSLILVYIYLFNIQRVLVQYVLSEVEPLPELMLLPKIKNRPTAYIGLVMMTAYSALLHTGEGAIIILSVIAARHDLYELAALLFQALP